MRLRIITSVGVACLAAPAAATPDARANYKQAVQLAGDDDNDKALALVEAALATAPKDLQLLELKGNLLLKTRDYPGALAAYQAYIDAGAAGANRRAAQKIVASLQDVRSSYLEIAVSNGPAFVYLDSRTQGTLCTASPSCKTNMLPGDYKVIVERPGFDRWTQHVTVTPKQTTRVDATLVEKPSRVTVRVADPGARITIDNAPLADAPIAAGDHEIVVTLAGHGTVKKRISLHEGKAVDLDIALAKLVKIDTAREATINIDGTRVAIEDGGVPIPPGAHAVVVHVDGFHDATIAVPADRAADYAIAPTLSPLGALVHVDGAPAGAQLVVDGNSIASAPFHGPVEVAPGAHRIEIRAPGFLPYRDRGAFASAQPVQLRMTDMRPVSHRDTLIAGTVTLGVLALGAGASWFALRQQSAYEQRAALPGVTTTDPTLQDMRSSGQHLALAADIAYGLAAIGAGVSTYLWIREGRRESHGSLSLGVSPAGASVAGRF
jgi:PEGA domain-containing protein